RDSTATTAASSSTGGRRRTRSGRTRATSTRTRRRTAWCTTRTSSPTPSGCRTARARWARARSAVARSRRGPPRGGPLRSPVPPRRRVRPAALLEELRVPRGRLAVAPLLVLEAAVVGEHLGRRPSRPRRRPVLGRAGGGDDGVVRHQLVERLVRTALLHGVADADRADPVALPRGLRDRDRVRAAGAAARHRVRREVELRPRVPRREREARLG